MKSLLNYSNSSTIVMEKRLSKRRRKEVQERQNRRGTWEVNQSDPWNRSDLKVCIHSIIVLVYNCYQSVFTQLPCSSTADVADQSVISPSRLQLILFAVAVLSFDLLCL
ncbi:hypothetical protein Nepgr_002578 [Nepenthes gracilis]|uniref:Uncharacterized protein n=1 Tax=Nepenthes gracilis TaxID=150966 RepID=A0AAD3RXX0_NEPGR|nr:hypothetical protein Nepgr_002578 [Nepenthes gracilis]